MFKQKNNQSGFTLIELLVVVIIVAILAGVGIPLLSGFMQRARTSEADAGLGAIRTGMRSFFAENRTYVGATFANIGITTTAAANTGGDLDGRYFEDGDYTLIIPRVAGAPAPGATDSFCAVAQGGGGAVDAPFTVQVTGGANQVNRSVNEQGTFFNSLNCA